MAVPYKYQAKEVLNKVLNSGEDALNVDLSTGTVTVDSEFPAAATITDGFTNPATTSSMSMLMGWNSATWDRVIVKTATSDSDPNLDALNLLGTHSLLSARSADATTVGLTAENNTHNALHTAISDGGEIVTVTSNRLLVDGSGVTQPVSGTVTANAGSGTLAVSNAGLTSLAAAINSDLVDVNITDGTNALVMQADAGETEDERINAITSVSTVYGFDSEGSTGTKLRAVQVAADNAGLSTAPNVLVSGGIYKSALDTYADNDASPLHFDANGRLIIGGSAAEDAAIAGNPIPAGGRYDSSVRTLDNGDVGTLALDPTGALYTREYLGQAGSILVTGTTNAVTTGVSGTKFVAIQFLEDTTFDAGSEGLVASTAGLWPDDANASTTIDDNGGAVTGSEVFPQGMTIFGRWDGFKLDSGKVIGYLGYV